MQIDINENIMDVNNAYAEKNHHLLEQHQIATINIMGSPGAGKTTVLERLLQLLPKEIDVAVIEGDLATAKDAQRIAALGTEVIQINTDGGCHLDAKMISQTLPGFDLARTDLLLIENVGNLVCPADFALGEDIRLVILSITEGSDKPAKYPGTFFAADWVIMNKIDLLPYTDFVLADAIADIKQIKTGIEIFIASCRQGEESGLEQLVQRIVALVQDKKQ